MKRLQPVRRIAVCLLLSAIIIGLLSAVPCDAAGSGKIRTESGGSPTMIFFATDDRYTAWRFLAADRGISGTPAPEDSGEYAVSWKQSPIAGDVEAPPEEEPKESPSKPEKSSTVDAVKLDANVPAAKPAENAQTHLDALKKDRDAYLIRVNRALNNVTVYERDENGVYSVPVRAMVCSTGRATPLGTYRTSDKYEWRQLFGRVYGQYATRITGHILFHSVPYTRMRKNTLEYEEYNKLGTAASAGCVRLAVVDVKWIYDWCASGTRVIIYDDEKDPGPLGKPEAIVIDAKDPNRGWDPTDPDPANPWLVK